jgi:tRNA(Arg) A34 adenosine deaminase TadA
MLDSFLEEFIAKKYSDLKNYEMNLRNVQPKYCKIVPELNYEKFFMDAAFEIAEAGLGNKLYGPFGACVVKDNKIISAACNEVQLQNDPSAHAELLAIRRACKKLNTFNLKGCELYATGEPCPMCLSCILWANIEKVYFANPVDDAKVDSNGRDVDFKDASMYKLLQERDSMQPSDRFSKYIIADSGLPLKLIKLDVENSDRLYKKYSGKIY